MLDRVVRLILVGSAVLLQHPLLARAVETAPVADAEVTPASIDQAVAGGHWSRDGEEGFYRVLIVAGGVEHVKHRLFLQWIKVPHDPDPYRVVKTSEVRELSDGHGFIIKITTELPELKVMKLSVRTTDRSGNTRCHTVTARADRSYAIEPPTASRAADS